MKKNFVLIAALIAALTVAFVSCGDDGVVSGTGEATPAVSLFAATPGQKIVAGGGKAAVVDDYVDFSVTGGGAIMTVTTKAKEGETITITYIVKSIAGGTDMIIKNPDWSDATGAADSLYPTFKVGEEAKIEVKADGFKDPKAVSFQRKTDTDAFLVKIISVTSK